MRLDAERRDRLAGLLDQLLDGPARRLRRRQPGVAEHRDPHRLESGNLAATLGSERLGDAQGVFALGGAVVADADLAHNPDRIAAVPGGGDRTRARPAV